MGGGGGGGVIKAKACAPFKNRLFAYYKSVQGGGGIKNM